MNHCAKTLTGTLCLPVAANASATTAGKKLIHFGCGMPSPE